MPRTSFQAAIKQVILEEMRKDPRVFVMGEDVQSLTYADAVEEFGLERIRSTPISEAGFFGAGIGAALTGMRPIVEGGFSTFLYSAMDQIVNQAAKSRYMFGGQACIPLVIRLHVAYSAAAAAHHSDRPWGLFAQVPGLKILLPASPYDAAGLFRSAIRDGNPVLFFCDGTLQDVIGEVPRGEYTIPIGAADVKRVGSDLTIVAVAGGVQQSLVAAEMLQAESISVEIVDLRTVVPLDRNTVLASVEKTGRLIVVDPAPGTCSVASEVSATVAEHAFGRLKAPIIRVTAPDVPVPFSPTLEAIMYPTPERIVVAARRVCGDISAKTKS